MHPDRIMTAIVIGCNEIRVSGNFSDLEDWEQIPLRSSCYRL
jgi:hypothetical protein